MSTKGHVVVGCASHPFRGVLLAIDDTKMIITPEVARTIARQLIESADRIDATGGASATIVARSKESPQAEVPGILRDLGFDPPEEPS